MFTGIIEKIGYLTYKKKKSGSLFELGFRVDKLWPDLKKGESIAVDGVCLTVTRFKGNTLYADISQPTITATTLHTLSHQGMVNLERALCAGARLGGHIVQGHVDGKGTIETVAKQKGNIYITVRADKALIKGLIVKGSVACDGISLTVQRLTRNSFTMVIIPHTFQHTTLAHKKKGSEINIEIDMMSKYVQKQIATLQEPLNVAYLQQQGF